MAQHAPGRHRAPGRHNPFAELRLIAKESAQPTVRGVAIVAASGGLVASTFAGPAHATEGADAVVAAGAKAVTAPAVSGPADGSVAVGTALSSIGYGQPAAPAKKTAAAPKPIVIKDVVIEAQRAAEAKRKKAEQERREAAERAERERRQAAERAQQEREAAAAAAERATTQRASRTASRTATSSSTSTATTTTKKANPAPQPAQTASGLVGIAQRAFGVPYRYGGTSLGGFDCSGLTQWVYRQAGVSIPRTASAQQSAASRVSSPRAGDLVFFGYPAYHVGIYVSPGRLIDAQRPGTVVGNHSIWTTPSGYGRF